MNSEGRNQRKPLQFYTPAINTFKSSSSASAPCNKSSSYRSPFDRLGLSDPSHRLFRTNGSNSAAKGDASLSRTGTNPIKQVDPALLDYIRTMALNEEDESKTSSEEDTCVSITAKTKQNDENEDPVSKITKIPAITTAKHLVTIDEVDDTTPPRPALSQSPAVPRVFVPCPSPVASRPPSAPTVVPAASKIPAAPSLPLPATKPSSQILPPSLKSSLCIKSQQSEALSPTSQAKFRSNVLCQQPLKTEIPNPTAKPSSKSVSVTSASNGDGPVHTFARPTKPASDSHSHSQRQSHSKDLKTVKVNNKTYSLLSVLGEGGSAKVYQIYDPVKQVSYACKYVDMSKAVQETRQGYENEIHLLLKLKDCERVVKLHDYERVMNGSVVTKLILVMEKGDADLRQLFKSTAKVDPTMPGGFRFHPADIKFYWKEMLEAVNEIHQKDVVHADIKPVNFISVGGKLKLIDFGIANAIETDHTSVIKDNQIGTVAFMAPESFARSHVAHNRPVVKLNCKADIWALGSILYYLVYGRALFHEYQTMFDKMQAITNDKCKLHFPPHSDEDLVDCLKQCLQRDPKARPTAQDLLNHPYLAKSTSREPTATYDDPIIAKIVSILHSSTPEQRRKIYKVSLMEKSNSLLILFSFSVSIQFSKDLHGI